MHRYKFKYKIKGADVLLIHWLSPPAKSLTEAYKEWRIRDRIKINLSCGFLKRIL